MNGDHIFITQKIHLRNFTKLIQLIFQILFFVYFAGLYFFVLLDIGYQISQHYIFKPDYTNYMVHPDEVNMDDFDNDLKTYTHRYVYHSYFLRNIDWQMDEDDG